MADEIRLPSLGDAEGGEVAEWYRQDGEWIEQGEALVAVDVDKVTVDVPAPNSGFLVVVAPEGTQVKVGGTLAWLLQRDEPRPAAAPENGTESSGA